jgi:hypothetical protein
MEVKVFPFDFPVRNLLGIPSLSIGIPAHLPSLYTVFAKEERASTAMA